MPTFEIPDGPTTLELKRSGPGAPATGTVVFNVTNTSQASRDGRLGIVVAGASKDAWFSIDGERERPFAAGETQTATIKVSAPADVPEGNYPFRLRAVAVDDPDNDHAEGPVTTANVPTQSEGTPPPPKWWLWILIGLLVLVVIGAALWFAFGRGGDNNTVVQNNATGGPVPPPQPAAAIRLEPGYDRPGLDIQGGQTVANVQACVQMCQQQDKCVAMTYVFTSPGVPQNGVCWIKYGIPPQSPNAYMISGVKVPG